MGWVLFIAVTWLFLGLLSWTIGVLNIFRPWEVRLNLWEKQDIYRLLKFTVGGLLTFLIMMGTVLYDTFGRLVVGRLVEGRTIRKIRS